MGDDDLNSIFERMGRQRPRNLDENYQMEIDFKESVLGVGHDITLPSGKKFHVQIPPGVIPGTRLRFTGRAESGGDVYVQLSVRPTLDFTRTGNDLESEVNVSLADAILGGEIRVPTIDGAVSLKIPPNISRGQRMRIGNKGVPMGDGKRGAQIVKLNIQMPTAIDDEFKEAVEAWRKRLIIS